jgi:hypothetical protein
VVRRLILAAVILFSLPYPAFSASLYLSPVTQTIDEPCVVHVSADLLISASGLDIEIGWEEDIVECTSVRTSGGSPIFQLFRVRVDNGTGNLEAVLIYLSRDGFTGSIDSLLILTFEPVSDGTSQIDISEALLDGDPVLVDQLNGSIGIETSSAEIVVDMDGPTPPITAVTLQPNYPNPFNPGTMVRFDLPSSSSVSIRIFDASGKHVRTLIDGREYPAGSWEEEWDGKNNTGNLVQSGIYFCVLDASGSTDSRKLVVLR